jgi:putative acetyltransferase
MHLRKYCPEDCDEIMELFKNTVHHVNARNYTPEQLDAWAPDKLNREQWNRSLSEHNTVVAVQNNTIVGFGDIDSTGYLDRLFVHYLHQREGIATAICDLLEQSYKGSITTDASITAKQFFENRGYRVIRQQTVVRNGISLKNFVMEKA